MALVRVIQPPIMKLPTTKEERLIRMTAPREVSKWEKILFSVGTFTICAAIAPGSLTLIGMLCFGNLLKESGVTERLAVTARTSMIDIVTILLGFTVGASTQAQTFLTPQSLLIFGFGVVSCARAAANAKSPTARRPGSWSARARSESRTGFRSRRARRSGR